MRDGTELSTSIHFPDGEGPWPVKLTRTPYNRLRNKRRMANLARASIASNTVIIVQNTRGKWQSQGEPRPFYDDGAGKLQDGHDTVKWVLAQPWCDGKIMTFGGSAGGITQFLLDASNPPGIAGQAIAMAPMSLYHGLFYRNGVFLKSLVEGWLERNKFPQTCLETCRSHPYYDEFWKKRNMAENVGSVDWPIMLTGGWYDLYADEIIQAYVQIRKCARPRAREGVRLIMKPCKHGASVEEGELTFPDELKREPKWWINRWQWENSVLRDQPLPENAPRVAYFTMGELPAAEGVPGNEWRRADDWPPPSTLTDYYLTVDGRLIPDETPGEGCIEYSYDPRNPVPTRGGNNFGGLSSGIVDQRENEKRNDVIVFTSDTLEEPLEITGTVRAAIYASTDAPDTDFTAKLSDVYPDGRSMQICDGIARLSLRNGLEQPQPVKPGQVYRVEIDIGVTSTVLNKGHCLRLAVSSSNFPRFERNPNTGSTDWRTDDTRLAHQAIRIGGGHPSCLILPVVRE